MNVSSVGNVFGLIKQLVDTKNPTVPLIETASEKPVFDPSKKGVSIERSTPEAEGVPSQLLLELVKMLRSDKTIETHDLLILRHGKVILEAWFDDGVKGLWKQTYSSCKSITALAVGFALQENLFALDTKICDIFPEEGTPFARKTHKDITVEHLLSMTAGVTFGEADSLVSENWISGFMNASVKGDPGEMFSYNSVNSYMLSAIIKRTSGMGLVEYLTPRLFEPLGIGNLYWEKSPEGIEKGGWGMYLAPEDMAKIGLFVMNGGSWCGENLLSSAYIREMTSRKSEAPEGSGRFYYGYHTWCGKDTDSFLFSGMLDQNVLGFRDSDILIVVNSGNTSMFQQSAFFSAVFKCFVDEVGDKLSDTALPENDEAKAELDDFLDSCRIGGKGVPLPSECALLDGKKYVSDSADAVSTGLLPVALQLFYNNYTKGLLNISFEIKNEKFYVLYREKDALHRFPVGFDSPRYVNMKFSGCVFRVAVSGVFAKNEDDIPVLKIRLAFTETPCVRYLKFFFDGDDAVASHRETPGMAFASDGIYSFKRSLEEMRLLKGAVGKVDDDYLDYRINKTFAPSIKMSLEKEVKEQ